MKTTRTILKFFERLIVGSLILMMIVVILLSTIQLGRILVMDIFAPPNYLLEINELLDIFGFFMLILIGVELLETIRAYLDDHEVHVEIVLEVALIAVARKVVIIDVKEYSYGSLLAIAAIVLSLAAAYYLQRKTRNQQTDLLKNLSEKL
ncbi:MAG: phosphate-starvation-inducible PsiE family protein [Chloroflexi bacterium]|nr:phosphate-starvation-inducible PsiE family protein [Chloroflexota bacterium]